MEDYIALFIPQYPSTTDEGFIGKISNKKEFFDLRAEKELEKDPGDNLLRHQRFLSRFFSPDTQYDRGLVYWNMGSGKSCAISAVAEINKLKTGRKTMVFVGNKVLDRNFKREINEKCAPGVYTPKLTREELEEGVDMSEKAADLRLNKEIKKTYKFVRYRAELKRISKLSDELVKKRYSHVNIILDEGHRLRLTSKTKGEYNDMYRFLHLVEDCRILIATGTPIWDQPNEFGSLMNLLAKRKEDEVPTGIEFDKRYLTGAPDFKLKNEKELRKKWRGKITFLREMMSNAKKTDIGVTKPYTKYIKIVPCVMSPFQSKVVDNLSKKIISQVTKKGVARDVEGGALYKEPRQASNFVFPDGTIDVKHMEETKGSDSILRLDPETRKAVKDDLAKLSSKFAFIVDLVKKNPTQLFFIYMERVTGCGALLLGLVLSELGLGQLKDIVTSTGVDGKKTFLAKKQQRFAIISSDKRSIHEDKKVKDVIDFYNRKENMHGEYLQVLIGSKKVSLGITLKNTRKMIIAMPHWNVSEVRQAMYRTFRFGSHDDLPPDEQNVEIYSLVAVPFDKKYQSIDLYIQIIGEDKDRAAAPLVRLSKEIAFDCALNYSRNVVGNDENGSRDCNYTECNYTCDGMVPNKKVETKDSLNIWSYDLKGTDLTTYNKYYSGKEVAGLIKSIISLYNTYFYLHLSEIERRLKMGKNRMLLLMTLDQMIDKKIPIRDKNGFRRYLKEDGNFYFLSSEIGNDKYENTTYISNPFLTERIQLEEINTIVELEEDRNKIPNFCEDPGDDMFNDISYKGKILLLESSIAMSKSKLSEEKLEVVDKILEELDSNVYEMEDGVKVHVLYTDEFTGTSYNISAKAVRVTGKMRGYSKDPPYNGEWAYVPPEEEPIYIAQIRKQMEEHEKGMKENPYGVYGRYTKKDNKFRIVEDKGKVCTNYDLIDLVRIMDKIEYYPKMSIEEYKDKSREGLITEIKGFAELWELLGKTEGVKEYSTEELRSLISVYSLSKAEICAILKKGFQQKKIYFVF